MDRYADGDEAAFAEVYDQLAPRLFSFFVRQTRDRARAEDLVQQTLLQIHVARGHFVRGSDPLPWAYCIGRRLMIDSHRRTKREVLFDSAEDDAAALDLGVSRDTNPQELASAKQLAQRVDDELSKLSEPQRAAYTLVRQEGLSVAQAAEVLGTTPGAIKVRAHRVYEALRAVLGVGRNDEQEIE
ncbi:MAG: RNA polymerase sigma factor [Polyangiales bacterium]